MGGLVRRQPFRHRHRADVTARAWVAVRPPTAPATQPPSGACDTHTHIFGPFETFPVRHPVTFPLPLAPFDLHVSMRRQAGLERGILVQPAHYGFDHSAMLKALEHSNRVRGIGLANAEVSDHDLDRLQTAGVRGLRFTEVRNPDGSVRAGSVGVDQLRLLAPRMRERGWQAHVWAGPSRLDEILPDLSRLGLPLVIDHMGMPEVGRGVDAPSFQRLLGGVRDGALWVKLSVCRVSSAGPHYADLKPFHDALVAANPQRLLWASDWPFIRMDNPPDVGALLDRFADWVDDPALQKTILSDNPANLFGFDAGLKEAIS
jgi:predicted TIM-barrel fold metal-dependent hydrolase